MRRRLPRLLIIPAIAGIASFHLLTLTDYPTITCDEALYGSQASQFLTRGTLGMDVYEAGDPFYRDLNMVHMGRVTAISEAGLFAVTGVTWWASRFFGLLGLAAASAMLYILGKRLYGSNVALASALLFPTTLRAFLSGHVTRPDIWGSMVVMLGTLGVLVLMSKPRSFWFAAAMGLLGMVAVDVHGYLLGFVMGFCLAVFIQFGLRERRLRIVFGYAVGVLAGCALWLITHTLPDPAQSMYQMSTGYRMLGNLPLANGIVTNVISFGQWLGLAFWEFGKPLSLGETFLTILGIIFALRRRDGVTWVLLVIIGVSLAVYMMVMGQRFVQYAVYWSPMLILLGMKALHELILVIQQKVPGLRRLSAPAILSLYTAGLAVANFAGAFYLVTHFEGGDYMPMARRLAEAVPSDTRVMADSTWWWTLNPERIFSDSDVLFAAQGKMLAEGPRRTDAQVVQEVMANYRPDYVLVDHSLSCNTDVSDLWREWTALVEADCELVTRIDGPWVDKPGFEAFQLGQTVSVYHCPQP
jgi:4-amino-4-deoxy-L-arabinose transferase-like glycosyltransferase